MAETSEVLDENIPKSKIWQVIGASSAGTVIEWYDFYIFGSLAAIISPLFYPKGNDTLALIAYLSTFAVGFIVRPFGALFFGRIGDLVGRKFAFLITLLLMGGATAAVGFLPTYETIGIFAPIALIVIRILQGLALGGEYGGAAIYVAEHVPDNKRGFYTSFIQITASFGLLVSLAVILIIQNTMSASCRVLASEGLSAYAWGDAVPVSNARGVAISPMTPATRAASGLMVDTALGGAAAAVVAANALRAKRPRTRRAIGACTLCGILPCRSMFMSSFIVAFRYVIILH